MIFIYLHLVLKKLNINLIKIFTLKPKIVFFMLPESYFLFGTLTIFFPNIKKVLLRRSLNYYHSNIFYKYYEFFLHKFTYLFICNSYAAKNNLIIKEIMEQSNCSQEEAENLFKQISLRNSHNREKSSQIEDEPIPE